MSKHRFKTNTDLKQISKIYVKENWEKQIKKWWKINRGNTQKKIGIKLEI